MRSCVEQIKANDLKPIKRKVEKKLTIVNTISGVSGEFIGLLIKTYLCFFKSYMQYKKRKDRFLFW